jgi:TonB family protein
LQNGDLGAYDGLKVSEGIKVADVGATDSKLRSPHVTAIGLATVLAIWPYSLWAQTLINPSELITPSDYPASSLMRGDEGITIFKLSLGPNGRATDCKVIESSGYAELDSAACRLMVERAKFDMSVVPATNLYPTYTNRVRWTIPTIQAPRPLLFGVTVKSSPQRSDPNRTKCEYSDGQYRVVVTGSPCARALPKLTIQRNGRPVSTNIFDQYMFEADRWGNAASAFNVGILLIDNGYREGVSYLQKSSQLGNHMASATLCNLQSMEEFSIYLDFNPNQALEYCMLSYKQNYSWAPLVVYNAIMQKYGRLIDPEIANRAKSTIVAKSQTAFARMTTPGNEVVRPKDYPRKDNSRQIGGKTQAIFEVSEQGKVKSCLIAQSTYSYDLDQRVCTRLREAADFTPAVIDGKPSVQWTTQTVTWVPAATNEPSTGSILMRVLLGVLGAAL